MTAHQLRLELGIAGDSDVSGDELAVRQQQAQAKALWRVCDVYGLRRRQLTMISPVNLAAMLGKATGAVVVNASRLPEQVDEFIRSDEPAAEDR